MKYSLIFIIALSASLTASAGFLDKVSKLSEIAKDGVGAVTTVAVEVKDASKFSKKELLDKYNFSEEEYSEWIRVVVEKLSESNTAQFEGQREVVVGDVRVKIFDGEKIIAVNEAKRRILSDLAVYTVSSMKQNGCRRVTYVSVAMGQWTDDISDVKNIVSASFKKYLKVKEAEEVAAEKVRAAAEKIQKEKENQKILQEMEASRSGVVAYSSKGLQWGDSEKIVNLIWPEVCFEEINRLGLRALRAGNVDDGEKSVRVLVDPEVGLFQLDITFAIRMFGMGGSVTVDDLKRKYVGKYGAPGVKKNEAGEAVSYRWMSENEVVVLQALPLRIKLTNPALTKKLEEADRKREEEAEKKRKSSAADVLDF